MAQVRGELKTWHKVTVDFQGPERSETAATFRDYRLDVSFTNDKTGEIFVVPGYFAADGNAAETGATSGDVWRVHFNPPSQGEWTYAASFRTGTDVAASTNPSAGQPLAAFDGQSGSFTVGPTDKVGEDFRAKGMLEYTGEHYLRHAGTGEPFLKGGANSPENFLPITNSTTPRISAGWTCRPPTAFIITPRTSPTGGPATRPGTAARARAS